MAYGKLKASLTGSISAQTIEPQIYGIDWTENPICSGKRQGSGSEQSSTDTGLEQSAANLQLTEKPVPTPSDADATDAHSATTAQAEVASPPSPTSNFAALLRGAPYDYVLLTDCVFSAELAVPLVNTILCGCGPRTTVICCHEIRDEVSAACGFVVLLHCIYCMIPDI
jgi:hypothetical protein